MIIATSVMRVTKMGNIVPRAVIEPTSLAFGPVSNYYITGASLMSPLDPRIPVYAAPCLRGQTTKPF